MVLIFTWAVRALAAFNVLSAALFVNDALPDEMRTSLWALLAVGGLGAVVTFAARAPWVVAIAGLATAAMPSVIYPVSFIVVADSLVLLVFWVLAKRQAEAAEQPAGVL